MPVTLPPPTIRSAEDLLLAFERSGDPAPFAEIVRRYSGLVYGVCYRVTRNAHDAEDATQATFLKLATQARTQSGVPRVGPWLQQVAKTTAVDLRRSRSRRQNREQVRAAIEQQQQGSDDATDSAGMDELKQLLRDEVDRLPVHYRTPLILYYFGGLSTEQIAVELKTNAKALAVRLFRGRKMLGSRLKDRGIVTAGGAMVTLAVADAILGTMANAVWSVPGSAAGGGAVAVAGGGWASASAGWSTFSGSSGWATSHTALCASIADRVVAITRASAAGALAGKWKLSVVVAVAGVTALAGSSEAVRASAVVQKVGDIIQDIGAAIRGIGRGPTLKSPSLPSLRADAAPPSPPAAPTPDAGKDAPPLIASVPSTGNVSPSTTGMRPLPVLAAAAATGSGSGAVVAVVKPYGFGADGDVPAARKATYSGEGDRTNPPPRPAGPSAGEALLALSASRGPVATATSSGGHELMVAEGSRGSVFPRSIPPVARTLEAGFGGRGGIPLDEVPPILRPAIIAATYGSNPPPEVLAMLAADAAGAAGTSLTEGAAGGLAAGSVPASAGDVAAALASASSPAGDRGAGGSGGAGTGGNGAVGTAPAVIVGGGSSSGAQYAASAAFGTAVADGLASGSGLAAGTGLSGEPSPPQFVQPSAIVPATQSGTPTGVPGVPEPSVGLVAAGLLALLGRRPARRGRHSRGSGSVG